MSTHPIVKCREERDLTQAGFARLMGVTDMTVSRWERGVIVPRRKYWSKLEEFTGQPIAAVIAAARPAGGAQ